MPLCAYDGCDVSSPKKIQPDGYCNKHSELQKKLIEDLRTKVATLEADNAKLKADNVSITNTLNQAVEEIKTLTKHVNDVRGAINTSNYQWDERN